MTKDFGGPAETWMWVLMVRGSLPGRAGSSLYSSLYWPTFPSTFSGFLNQKPSVMGWALVTSFTTISAKPSRLNSSLSTCHHEQGWKLDKHLLPHRLNNWQNTKPFVIFVISRSSVAASVRRFCLSK